MRPMPSSDRLPMEEPETSTSHAAAFCEVEKCEPRGSRHFVVHVQAPRFVVEVTTSGRDAAGRRSAVIRRVCVPNSWSGDYHRCGRLLGAALKYFETPPRAAANPRRASR